MNRQSRNSRQAAEDAAGLPSVSNNGAVRSESPTPSGPSMDQPSPQFLATVIAAVKSALRDEQGTATTSRLLSREGRDEIQRSSGPSAPVVSVGEGQPSTLLEQTNAFQLSGAPPSFAQSVASAQDGQGRSPTLIPSFVTTFSSPRAAVSHGNTDNTALSASGCGSGRSLQCVGANLSNQTVGNLTPESRSAEIGLSPIPPSQLGFAHFQQPFIVGPGYSPVPFKLVSQIVAGKFIDLADLLSANFNSYEMEPQLLFDGRLVLAPAPKKPRRQITDIVQWMEAFTIYSSVLISHFPQRWKDLNQYKLLILRTFRQYAGRVWHSYDVAFREQAAATRLTDWSQFDVQLFNFHAAGANVKGSSPTIANNSGDEPRGNERSSVRCISWNAGKCFAPSALCKFSHTCLNCYGEHRRCECPEKEPKKNRRSVSPPPKKQKRH